MATTDRRSRHHDRAHTSHNHSHHHAPSKPHRDDDDDDDSYRSNRQEAEEEEEVEEASIVSDHAPDRRHHEDFHASTEEDYDDDDDVRSFDASQNSHGEYLELDDSYASRDDGHRLGRKGKNYGNGKNPPESYDKSFESNVETDSYSSQDHDLDPDHHHPPHHPHEDFHHHHYHPHPPPTGSYDEGDHSYHYHHESEEGSPRQYDEFSGEDEDYSDKEMPEDDEEDDDDDDSLGFPPGHVIHLDDLMNYSDHHGGGPSSDDRRVKTIKPLIPSYFFCPLTQTIMKDPVLTPDGSTFERRAILRYLILSPENPLTGNPLSAEELEEDRLVRGAIDKARREAWVRYVLEFRDEGVERIIEEERERLQREEEEEEEEGSYEENDLRRGYHEKHLKNVREEEEEEQEDGMVSDYGDEENYDEDILIEKRRVKTKKKDRQATNRESSLENDDEPEEDLEQAPIQDRSIFATIPLSHEGQQRKKEKRHSKSSLSSSSKQYDRKSSKASDKGDHHNHQKEKKHSKKEHKYTSKSSYSSNRSSFSSAASASSDIAAMMSSSFKSKHKPGDIDKASAKSIANNNNNDNAPTRRDKDKSTTSADQPQPRNRSKSKSPSRATPNASSHDLETNPLTPSTLAKRSAISGEKLMSLPAPALLQLQANIASGTSTVVSETSQSASAGNHHGWTAPLGVYKIRCAPPGLVVTTDVHRRSKVVKRKIIKKCLKVEDDYDDSSSVHTNDSHSQQGHHHDERGRTGILHRVSKMNKDKKHGKKTGGYNMLNTSTTVISRDLIIPDGSYVDVVETTMHGGRVRGKIFWEEEIAVELDLALKRRLNAIEKEEAEQRRAKENARLKQRRYRGLSVGRKAGKGGEKAAQLADQTSAKGGKAVKSNRGMFSIRKRRTDNHPIEDIKVPHDDHFKSPGSPGKNPFTSELFSSQVPHHSPARKTSPSPPPLTTIKYTGWISLQWAGTTDNQERDNAIRRREKGNSKAALTDEDEGPWSYPLNLGVYRIQGEGSGKHLPLYNDPDKESNIVDYLYVGQVVEVLETQLVLISKNIHDMSLITRQHFGVNAAQGVHGVREVRARCIVPYAAPPSIVKNGAGKVQATLSKDVEQPQKKFRSGWISIYQEKSDYSPLQSSSVSAVLKQSEKAVTNANAVPLGAYVAVSTSGCIVTEGARRDSKTKTTIAYGASMEVVATRIEFEESNAFKCRCGRETLRGSVAVRGLVASGGHVTLFILPMSSSGTFESHCACGLPVQRIYATPVQLGTYKITHSKGVALTAEITPNSETVTMLEQNTHVDIVETRVEEGGCVRGRVNLIRLNRSKPSEETADGDDSNETTTTEDVSISGWVSLFEPPSYCWAQLVHKKVSSKK